MADPINYESEILDTIHSRANTKKNECFFVGFVEGVLANEKLDPTELEPLLAECAAICRQVADEDAREIIAESSAGHKNTINELLDLLKQIAEIRLTKIDASCKRSSANRLLGFCAGVNCDAIITTTEAKSLLDKLNCDHELEADPRIQALSHRLVDALEDGFIDPDEADEIGLLITHLVGDSYADTGIASSDSLPVMQDIDQIEAETLEGARVVLTGAFHFGSRKEVSQRMSDLGAVVQSSPSSKTDIVVIGSNGSPNYTYKHHGGKLAKALELRSAGPAPRIYVEAQLREYLV